ncbi:hypothetical protein NL154_09485 [Rhizobium sp. YTUHZ044]|uniref:hypothetical protein n=1 Tax=Rhizobium sp. YTUHZ044 TaxID=2962678 RepID=UPI003DA9EC3F
MLLTLPAALPGGVNRSAHLKPSRTANARKRSFIHMFIHQKAACIHQEFCSLFVLVYPYDPVNRIENLEASRIFSLDSPAGITK